MSKRRHNFGTKRFKEKSLFIFHARIALKSLILLFVRLIARGARIRKTHTHTHTDRQDKYCNPRACAPRVNDEEIDLKVCHRDLGILISGNLSWTNHYDHICSRAYRMLGLLRRVFSTTVCMVAKKNLYTSLVIVTNELLFYDLEAKPD